MIIKSLLLSLAIISFTKITEAQNLAWAKTTGGTNIDHARAIAVDSSGWVYTTGYFNGTVDFDPGPGTFFLTSSGMQDVYVSKLDSAGNFKWALQLGGSSDEAGYGIAVDSNGYVHAIGRFTGTADFDPGSGVFNLLSSGSDDVFTIKLQNELNTTTSINEDSWGSKIKLYPNPTNGSLTIESERLFSHSEIGKRFIF
jgi:hypothetical protein